MAQLNTKTYTPPPVTHEGTVAQRITPLQELIRTTMSCMLWEDGFYEDGEAIAARIKRLVHAVSLEQASKVALEARNNMKLRHVPMLIAREMARHPRLKDGPKIVGDTIATVIQRADELTEFLALYWADGKCPLSKQVKLGLARAFAKFNEYELAKYNRDKDIKLRDVLFLCHSKPKDGQGGWTKFNRNTPETARPEGFAPGEILYGKVVYDQLTTPDTWEVELSQSTDKLQSWMRLLCDKRLGDLAFLRNLRNMLQAGVPTQFIVESGAARRWGRVLPFRFIAAAQVVPQLEPYLEQWMFRCLEGSPMFEGRTAIVIDTSPSMWQDKISARSELTRFDAAAALAMLFREVCTDLAIYAFNERGYRVPPRRGFALRDALAATRGNYSAGGLGVKMANADGYDRIIVLTDGQWHPDDGVRVNARVYQMDIAKNVVPAPNTQLAYLIDVSTNKNSVGHQKWLTIDGWSEAVVQYIQVYEGAGSR